TFYHSAVSKDRAGVVDAIAGKDVGGIEIRLARQHGLAIHGVVRGLPDENARPFVTVQTGDNAQTLSGSRGIGIGPGGRFTLPAAQPGFYRLWASVMSGKTQLVSPMVEMQIENADPPDVELVLAPGMDITGTLVMEGDPPGAPEEKRTVRLESAGAGIGNILRQSGGEVGRDGAVHIE